MRKLFRRDDPKPENPVAQTGHVHVRYGGQSFDAAGLFIQWLTEHVNDHVAGRAAIHVELRTGYDGRATIRLLVAGSGYGTFKKTWDMEHLNELLRSDNGRGGLLRVEVQNVLRELRD